MEYLQRLGVTAVELLPVHHFVRDRHLAERGLTNYWGYNTIGFFAPDVVADLAYRLTGSSDLYESDGRRPSASVNFVTAHDGFTLADLVAYDRKHNEANGEDNRDGTDENLSWNCGVEGPTDDAAVLALRERQMRNFLATLFLSQGVPMLLGGDETGRTQHGNNNGWHSRSTRSQLEFTRRLIHFRLRHPVFHRPRFFQGRRIEGSEVKDLSWFRPDGKEMTSEEWTNGFTRCLGLRLAGDAIEEMDEAGRAIADDTFLVLLNAHHEPIEFVLPAHQARVRWELVLDTWAWELGGRPRTFRAGDRYPLEGRSLALLRLRRGREPR